MANPHFAIEPLFRSGPAQKPHQERTREPSAEIARLAALHREAEDTARLANLLGRTVPASLFLALAAGFATSLTVLTASNAAVTAWMALLLLGFAATARAYMKAIRAPFERKALTAFAADLTAVLTYMGFVWGAGAFLLLPAGCGLLAALAYAVVPAGGLIALLRARDPGLAFLAPAAMLSAFAMVLRPLPAGVLAAALTVMITAALGFAALRLERRALPRLAGLPFG